MNLRESIKWRYIKEGGVGGRKETGRMMESYHNLKKKNGNTTKNNYRYRAGEMAFAMQAWRPRFDPWNPCKHVEGEN